MRRLKPLVLQGRHVRLEPLRLQHAKELWGAARERDLWRYMTFLVRRRSDLSEWIRRRLQAQREGTALAFLQRDAITGAAFGSTSLFDVDLQFRRAEIGHTWIGASHRRTAANTEAKLLLLRHAFEDLGMVRVQFKCDARNTRSHEAILRLGATEEGLLRSFMLLPDGHRRDTLIFSILDHDWPRVRARLRSLLSSRMGAVPRQGTPHRQEPKNRPPHL